MDECPVCRVPLSAALRERCESPACPCFGQRAGSAAMEAAARSALARPYSRRGRDPAALLRQLDGQVIDGAQRRAEAYRAEVRRLSAPDRANRNGRELLLAMQEMEALGLGGIGHEPGWPA